MAREVMTGKYLKTGLRVGVIGAVIFFVIWEILKAATGIRISPAFMAWLDGPVSDMKVWQHLLILWVFAVCIIHEVKGALNK